MTARDRLDPETRDGLDLFLAAVPGGFGAIDDIVQRRAVAAEFLQLTTAGLPPNDQVISQERVITGPPDNPELTVRVYTPARATGVRLPGILMIHGGGMVMGSVAAEHIKAETYCESVNAVIVSTDYRKAPEHPYPAGPDDCYAALNWMVDHADELDIDPTRIAVLGGSAGGNLAISTTLRARDLAGPASAALMAP